MGSSNIISNVVLAVGAGASIDIRPPAGHVWKVTDFTSDKAFVTNVPDLQVEFTDGADTAIALIDPTTDPGKRTRQYEFYLTNAFYLKVTNTGGAGANIGWIGERVNIQEADVVAYLFNNAGGGDVAITSNLFIPEATYKITEVGCADFTVAGDINPDIQIGIADAAATLTASRITIKTMVRGQDKQPQFIIGENVGLNINIGAGVIGALNGIRIPETCISSIQDVVEYATLDIIPPIGDEWVITELAAETWAGGGAPDDYPDIIVAIRTTGNSDILKAGAASLRWNSDCVMKIDHTHFLRITENSAAANEVGISGYLQRSY